MFQDVKRLSILKLQFQEEEINPLVNHSKQAETYLPSSLFALPNGLIEKNKTQEISRNLQCEHYHLTFERLSGHFREFWKLLLFVDIPVGHRKQVKNMPD